MRKQDSVRISRIFYTRNILFIKGVLVIFNYSEIEVITSSRNKPKIRRN